MSKLFKITKLAAVENPDFPTPDKKDYVFGKENEGVSLPTDYYVIGTLLKPITKGESIEMLRINRNGVSCPGMFMTSLVKEFDGKMVETANSKYIVEEVTVEDEAIEKAKQNVN